MKEIIEKISFKKILWFFWLILVLFESYNMFIDFYNFSQLEKAKPILESIDYSKNSFKNINEFNEKYNAWIKPIKNCYDVVSYNWENDYLFWFKLESVIYKLIYWDMFYSYPSYDLPVEKLCTWSPKCTEDINRVVFERIISNPCKE